jgi:hypothetical protein
MSCLFNSLSYFIKEDSHKIRQTICDYLQENNPIIEGLETHDILKLENATNNENTYISNMRLMSTWGGAIEIQCACNIWNTQINVLSLRHKDEGNNIIEFIPLHKNITTTIEISWNGGHYEPIKI